MGVRSRAGKYDTFFIPDNKLDPRRNVPPRRAALISQSGAFVVSRLSNFESLDPTLAISLGNQIDLTVSDLLRTVGERDDVDCIGVYVEGFGDLDGLAFVRAVEEVTSRGQAGGLLQGRAHRAGSGCYRRAHRLGRGRLRRLPDRGGERRSPGHRSPSRSSSRSWSWAPPCMRSR